MIHVSGRQMDVGDALREHTASSINEVLERYVHHVSEVFVTFQKSHHFFECDVSLHLMGHITLHLKTQDRDPHHCVVAIQKKLKNKLKRYHGRLVDHRKKTEKKTLDSSHYVLDTITESIENTPSVIAEMPSMVMELSVDDAIMQLDLSSDQALMFKNIKTGVYNVLYRRADGNISWIAPHA